MCQVSFKNFQIVLRRKIPTTLRFVFCFFFSKKKGAVDLIWQNFTKGSQGLGLRFQRFNANQHAALGLEFEIRPNLNFPCHCVQHRNISETISTFLVLKSVFKRLKESKSEPVGVSKYVVK